MKKRALISQQFKYCLFCNRKTKKIESNLSKTYECKKCLCSFYRFFTLNDNYHFSCFYDDSLFFERIIIQYYLNNKTNNQSFYRMIFWNGDCVFSIRSYLDKSNNFVIDLVSFKDSFKKIKSYFNNNIFI